VTTANIPSHRRFRVALSFTGTRRHFVEKVADALAGSIGRDSVFYDLYYQAELARPNLDLHLATIYREDADLVVPFLCADYERSQWCKLEWRQMRDILKNVEEHRIMYFRFDTVPIAGVLSIDGYIEIGSQTPSQVADLILQRVPAPTTASTIIDTFPGLTTTDALVLNTACEILMQETDPAVRIETTAILGRLKNTGLAEHDIRDSIEVLHSRGYIAGIECFQQRIPLFVVSTRTFGEYLKKTVYGYEAIVERLASAVVSRNQPESAAIAEVLGQPEIILCHIIDDLAMHHLIDSVTLFGGTRVVMSVSVNSVGDCAILDLR
jgi:hypothetical protein